MDRSGSSLGLIVFRIKANFPIANLTNNWVIFSRKREKFDRKDIFVLENTRFHTKHSILMKKHFSLDFGMLVAAVFVVSSLHLQTVGAVTGPAREKAAIRFPTLGTVGDGQAVLLAIDDYSLPLKQHLCTYLTKPKVRPEPVLKPNRDNPRAPDHLAAQFYGTVLFDQGKYRMWYYPVHYGSEPSDLKQGPVCYAESNDGIHWVKPNLRQLEFKGSRDNNALKLPDISTQMAGVIKDESDPDPSRRYKMVYNTHSGGTWVFRTATSPDGTRWSFSPDFAVNQFIELSSFYEHNGLYVVNGQCGGRSEGGGPQGRTGYARISTDFEHWIDESVKAFALPEPTEAAERGGTKPYDQVHLGVGGKSFGNVVVGLYGLWHNQPGDRSRNIRDSWFGFAKTSCDLGLLVSNNGLHFREPVKGHVYLSRFESPATPAPGKSYPTILCQSGNGIVNVGEETRIYHGRWRNGPGYGMEYWGEVALATLPRDRWGALGLFPKVSHGSVWSAPIQLPENGCTLALNADGAGSMQVDVADERFQLMPKFSGSDSGRCHTKGGLDCQVSWPDANLGRLRGQTVRFRIRIAKGEGDPPRLYAVNLRSN